MNIAFYKGSYGTIVDKTICLVTGSIYSHCEIVFDTGESASSSMRDGGVRLKFIPFDHKWDLFPLTTDLNEGVVKQYFIDRIGLRYDYLGAVGAGIHVDLSSDNKKFCSRICSNSVGIKQQNFHPGSLFTTLSKKNFVV